MKINNIIVGNTEPANTYDLWLDPKGGFKYFGNSGWISAGGSSEGGKSYTEIEWNETSKLSDFLEPGIYICNNTKRHTLNDELPITNVWSESSVTAYISFTLIVNKVVSSDHASNKYERIGQTLILTNRAGNETKQYIRTLRHDFDGKWHPVQEIKTWKELKGVTILNVVSDEDLKKVTENGTYEGVINNNDSLSGDDLDNLHKGNVVKIPSGVMFKMEVQNNYAVVEALKGMGTELSANVVQKMNCLGPYGTVAYKYRVLKSNNTWTSWFNSNDGGGQYD